MRVPYSQGLLVALGLLAAPVAGAQGVEAEATVAVDVEATATVEAEAGGTVAPATVGGPLGLYIEPTIGMALPMGDETYDAGIDTSLVPSVTVGWRIPLGGGEATIAPEGTLTYMPLSVEDDLFSFLDALRVPYDYYVGRFRFTGGARFQVDLGEVYLFTRLGVGLEVVHADWEYWVGSTHYDDGEVDTGLVLLAGLGFGYRVIDMLGITLRIDFPTAMHWDDDDWAVPYDLHSTDVEMNLGVTIYL